MEFNFVTNLETCFNAVKDNPPLLYYSHIPTAVVALIIGFFVIFKNKNSLLSWLLFIISVTFSLWSILDLITWISYGSNNIMFAWELMNLVEPIVFVCFLYFSYIFIKKGDAQLRYKIISALLLLPVVYAISTKYNITHFSVEDCESKQGNLIYYIHFLEVFFSLWIIIFLINSYRSAEKEFKKQILLLAFGVVFFLVSFSWANITGNITTNWVITQYGLFGMPVFMVFLAYLIVKYKVFNIKLLGAQALVVSLVVLIGSMFAFVETTTSRILVGVTLALSSGMGWFLVKSVKLEVLRKEELQLMSDKLAQANDQLRKLDNAKSEFISIASHQLRTPLTAIKGFVSLLLEGSYGKLEPKQEDVLNKVYLSNDRLVNLVEDLLNISRIESGRMEFKFELCQAEDICLEVMDTFAIKAKEHGLSLEYKKPAELLPKIMIDGAKVREVISNMVDNAIKYTPKGGVTLKVEKLFGDAQKVPNVEGSIRVTVSDTGIGIPETELPYLFAKFSRGKDIKRLNAGGTGLGLYVGRNMIEASGGKIWAESGGEGKGSRFVIELPIGENKAEVEKRLEKFIEKM